MKKLKLNIISGVVYKKILFGWLIFSGLLFISGCSKSDDIKTISSGNIENKSISSTNTDNGFSMKIARDVLLFNKDLKVSYAINNFKEITSTFSQFTFYCSKLSPDMFGGEAFAWNNTIAVQGNWGYGVGPDGINFNERIRFHFPTSLHTQLGFLNREWLMTVGTTEIIFIAVAEPNVELRFIPKIK